MPLPAIQLPAVVRGRLTHADGRPVARACIRAFDRELRGETLLGQATTDEAGAYAIGYSSGQLSRPDKTRADLVVRASDRDGREVAASEAILDAPAEQTVDLVHGNQPYRGPAEFTRVQDALRPYLGRVAPGGLTRAEIEYLAAKTGLDSTAITHLAAAEQAAHRLGLPPAVCYGLFRLGVPTDPEALLRRGPRAVQRSLQAALDANIIPQAEVDPAQATAGFEQAVVARAFAPEDGAGGSSLGDLLATTALSRQQQEGLLLRALRHEGSSAAFWAGLRADPAFGPALVGEVQFGLQLGQITGNHLPLVRRLQGRRRRGAIGSARDLARLDGSAWRRLLATRQSGQPIGAPPGVPGRTERERIRTYAAALAGSFERRYPTAALAGRLAAAADPAQAAVGQYLTHNPEFDLGATSIATFLPGSDLTGTGDVAQLTADLKGLQRVYRLTPAEHRLEGVTGLLEAGLASAQSITRYGRDQFVNAFADTVGGAAAATQIYHNAGQTAAAALAVYTKYRTAQFSFSPWVLGSAPSGSADVPNWEALFGSPKSCACEPCRSVSSPAAYLVDILAFLDRYEVGGPIWTGTVSRLTVSRPTALTRLLQRRPDLGEMELSCANTDTLVPYVDLAIEVFENAVAGESIAYQTSWTAAELNANAEHLNPVAYDGEHLAGRVYPFELPFNLWLVEARIFLEHLGVSLSQLLETFRREPDGAASGEAARRAGEYLQLSPLARRVVAGETGRPLAELWGLTGDLVARLRAVPAFLAQAGLSYDQLLELLSARYINPLRGRVVITLPDLDPLDPGPGLPGPGHPPGSDLPSPGIPVQLGISVSLSAPCTLEGATLNRLTEAALERMHRFLRLQRTLGWTIGDLDRVLAALGDGAIDRPFLVRLADAKRLLARFGLPLPELLSWWSSIETTVYPQDAEQRSLYERLFLNNAVLNPVDDAFALNEARTGLLTSGLLPEHIPAVVAALEISAEEFGLLMAAGVTDEALNLVNLSRLYRTVSLARALGLSVAEFLAVRKLTGVDPVDRSRTGQTLAFVERVEQIQASAFSVAELDYLLRHVSDAAAGIGLSQEAIRAALEILRAGLSRIAREHAPVADPTGAHTTSTLALLLPPEVLPTAVSVIAGNSTLPAARQIAFVETYFASFLDPTAAVAQLVDPVGLSEPQARYEYVLGGALGYLARTAGEALIAQQLAADLGLELAAAQALIADYVPAALAALQALDDAADPAVYEAASRAYLRLSKIALALGKLGVAPADLPWVFGQEYAFGWYDLTRLPLTAREAGLDEATYRSWERLVGVFAFRRRFPNDDPSLFDVLAAGYRSASAGQVWDAAARLTGWARADVETLAGPGALGLVFPDDYRDERYLLRLDRAAGLLALIGLPAAAAITWAPTDDTEAMQATAQSIKQAAKARYDEATWLTVAPPLKDALRGKQRDALVTTLVATLAGVDQPSDLFEHFLIDGEMDACMDTSRLKQGIGSAQLFVQRCLMGLEPDVQLPAEAAAEWAWMKQYRLWEAARKLFLYPENWIEPDLRDDMTPYFKSLSGELRQSELTDESAEAALRTYLAQLDTADRQVVRSLYHQLETADDGTPIDRLHVLARTRNVPYVHSYRQRVDDAYWTPWEPVGVAIAGNHEFLAQHNGVLYLFMPTLDLQTANNLDEWTIRLQWSTYQNGQWTAPKQAEEALTFEAPRTENEAYFYFKTAQDGEDLLIVPLWHEDGGAPSFTGDDYLAFRISCGERVAIDDGPYTYTIEVPPETRLNHMTLTESESVDAPLALYWTDAGPGDAGLPEQDDVTVLGNTPGTFQLVLPHQYDYFVAQDAFFYHGITRVFHVRPLWSQIFRSPTDATPVPGTAGVSPRAARDGRRPESIAASGSPTLPLGDASFDGPFGGKLLEPLLEKKLQFATHHHPFVCDFVRRLDQGGLPALLQRATQSQATDYFAGLFDPNTDVVAAAYPIDEVEFAYGGAYSVYNQELFFHAPLLIAERLRQNQQFAAAQRWFHFIFDPLAGASGSATGPERFWAYYPFYLETVGETTLDMMLDLAAGDYAMAKQVEQWRKDPFQAHALARLRPQAYQKTVVMKYVQNLIDWGDQLFTLDTIESTNEATQLYVLAADILGDKPALLPDAETAPLTFNALRDDLDAFSNALVELENYVAPASGAAPNAPGQVPALTLAFGIPPNDTLLALWDTVADRLFKIRHCMNIAGVVRQLPLFEPPLEPGLLVQAAAQGVDLGGVLADLYAPLPPYRFQVMQQKALELCAEVRSLGAALLGALEKADAEALALLRAGHEAQLLEAIRQVREWQVDEADEARQALERTQEVIAARQAYYGELITTGWNEYESQQQDRLQEAQIAQLVSQGFSLAASGSFIAATVVKGFVLQPANVLDLAGKASQALGQASGALASYLDHRAAQNALLGNHERRKEEWRFQMDAATKELEQIATQIRAAAIRRDIAARELQNHETQTANAQATSALMQSKYSNEALYDWMISQISPIYFTSYQLAYDLAQRAERAFRHELGLTESGYISLSYWDNLKKGLLAGERLAYDLRRMELAYLEENRREYEITKHVSLSMLDPIALLLLKERGECYFSLPEAIFDLDFPGHYLRRIKSISLTVPCVTGPYTGVSATLTLLGNRIRRETGVDGGYAETGPEDGRFQRNAGAIQSIATSDAQHDSGLFELNFRDERYLPFEGAGAISDWRLELPRAFRSFDYGTISDAIVHVRYTARDGGATFRTTVEAQQTAALNSVVLAEAERGGLDRLFSLRHEFPDAWHTLLYPAGAGEPQSATLPLSVERFPFPFQSRAIAIATIELFVKVSPAFAETVTADTLKLALASGTTASGSALPSLPPLDDLLRAAKSPAGAPGDWTLTLWQAPVGNDRQPVPPEAIEEVLLVCHYTVGEGASGQT